MARHQMPDDQQKKIAIELFLEAWDKACDIGVSSDMLAEVLIYLALTDLVEDRGEDWTAELIEALPERIRGGDFTFGEQDAEGGTADPG